MHLLSRISVSTPSQLIHTLRIQRQGFLSSNMQNGGSIDVLYFPYDLYRIMILTEYISTLGLHAKLDISGSDNDS